MGGASELPRCVARDGLVLEGLSSGSILRVEPCEILSDQSSAPSSPAPLEGELRLSSWPRTAMVVMGQVMGTGVLALPHACAQLGWVVGLGAIALFAAAGTYAGILLARSRALHPEEPESYAELARLTGGRSFGAFTRVAILGSWTLILPYYLLTCAQAAELAFAAVDANGQVSFCQWHWTAAVAIALLPPLQLRTLHQISLLALVSTIAVSIAIVVALASLLWEAPDAHGASATRSSATTSLWPPSLESPMRLYAYTGEIIYAFQGHSIFLELVREMKIPKHFSRALYVSNAIMAFVYVVTSMVGYMARGNDVAGFLPESMSVGLPRAIVGGLLAFHTAVGYLITALPLQREMLLLISPCQPMMTASCASSTDKQTLIADASLQSAYFPDTLRWLLISLFQLAFSFLVANGIPFFALFQSLLGSLTGAPILFGWPAFFFLSSCHLRGRSITLGDFLGCGIFLFVCTPLLTGLGTINAIVDIQRAWVDSAMSSPFMCTR